MRNRRTNAQLAVIDQAIIEAVAEDAPVSLRGVYYRAESAGAIPKTESGYGVIQRQLLKLRRTWRVPYQHITDGTRWITRPKTWDSAEEALQHTADAYRQRLWADQNAEVMVFTEKDAISGILLPVTRKWDVPLGVLRGYNSESFCWTIAMEIREALQRKDEIFIYHLGDHDPSGVDAFRSFEVNVRRIMTAHGVPGDSVHFIRLAVTPEQIITMGLPTRPTKTTDSRAKKFRGESVEVDAIRAPALRGIVENAITQHIDQDQFDITQVAERSEREILTRLAGAIKTSDGP